MRVGIALFSCISCGTPVPGSGSPWVLLSADTAQDSGAPPEALRTCEPLTVALEQVHTDLSGGVDPTIARNALPGPGLGVGDLDGDGHLDVILARPGAAAMRFDGDGSGTLDRGPDLPATGETVALADMNGDGRLDVILAGSGDDTLLLATPDGGWDARPLPQASHHTTTVSVLDADLDGDLDLFAARHAWPADFDRLEAGDWPGDGHALLRNDGDGGLTPTPLDIGPTSHSLAFQGAPVDIDLDGDLDVYLNNDFGAWAGANITLESDGRGGLTPRPHDGADRAMFGMGTSVADPNQDGAPDLFVSDIGHPALFLSSPEGPLAEAAAAWGLDRLDPERFRTSWGSRFVDLDGDGHDDLAIAHSAVPAELAEDRPGGGVGGGGGTGSADRTHQLNALMLHVPDHGFVDAAALGHTVADFVQAHGTKALVTADLDRDGRAELLTAGWSPDYDTLTLRTFRVLGGCGPGITVRLPLDGNGVGATVLSTRPDTATTRWMLPSGTYSSSAPEVYVGLGVHPRATAVSVQLLSGVQLELGDLPAGSFVDLTPP